MATAARLERAFGADLTVSFTLVSDTNALLFTPMLAEVVASSLEPTHISTPLRTSLQRTDVVRGRVDMIDLERHKVLLASDAGSPKGSLRGTAGEIPYDHLVLAVGSVSNYLGINNLQDEAFDFKTLGDAIRIRNHIIDVFDRADREPDPTIRRSLLTFVIAGGGFAGAELAGGLRASVNRSWSSGRSAFPAEAAPAFSDGSPDDYDHVRREGHPEIDVTRPHTSRYTTPAPCGRRCARSSCAPRPDADAFRL